MASWAPTPLLVHAKVVRPFMPDKAQAQKFLNVLYPGEEVYIFETMKDLWARGYTIHSPRPSDYSSDAVDIKRLPKRMVKVSVFPLACVKIIGQIETSEEDQFLTTDSSTQFEEASGYDESEKDDENDYTSYDDNQTVNRPKKHHRPLLPVANTVTSSSPSQSSVSSSANLAEEVKLTLKTISSTLFAVYSKSNFDFFDKLVAIYNELDDLRISLVAGILTKREEKMNRKRIAYLMNKFSKFLASGGGAIDRAKHSKSDIDGKESILARDEDSGELFTESSTAEQLNPAKIAQSQVLSAFSPNYPWGQSATPLVAPKNVKFEGSIPSNILVDVKQVVASSPIIPENYAGMRAFMYLRNAKRRLTEAFAINISPDQDLSLDNLAAALFTNIPDTAVNSGRIYLVALLTETIAEKDANYDQLEVYDELPIIRKGICAGVADISRIFSRRKGHLVSGQAHRFSIKLFSSYMDSNKQEVKLVHGMSSMMAKSMTMVNNGWGELVDRIISGSNRGVAINPRAERLILSIKEWKLTSHNKKVLDEISGSNNAALSCIPILDYSPLEKATDKLILRLVKVNVTNLMLKDKNYVTVHVKSSSETQGFRKGANEKFHKTWKFLSTAPEEHNNELIIVSGFPHIPTSGNDFLIFDIYLNKTLLGTSHYLVRSGKLIHDTGMFGKNLKSLEIMSSDNTSKGTIEFDCEYVGKTYNVDATISAILNWKTNYGKDLPKNEALFIETLNNVKRLNQKVLVATFEELCASLMTSFASANTYQLEKLKTTIFEALVLTLDIAVARNAEHVEIFETMLAQYATKFPKIGEQLFSAMTTTFDKFDSEWNSVGRALCRVSILILRIVVKCFSNTSAFQYEAIEFSKATSKFLSSTKDTLISDQLLIIEVLELYLEAFEPWFSVSEVTDFAVSWINANYLHGLGVLPDENANALINRKRAKEHSYIIQKLFFVDRLINGSLLAKGSLADKEKLLSSALRISLSIITSDVIDLDCSRLSLGVLLSICQISMKGDGSLFEDFHQLYFVLIRALPLFATQFTRFYRYCKKKKLLKPKRVYTDLFPSVYPFEEYTMDSIVDDSVFTEVLVEFTIIISFISKMLKLHYSEFLKSVLRPKSNAYSSIESSFNFSRLSSPEAVSSLVYLANDLIKAEYYPSHFWLSLHSAILETSFLVLKLAAEYIPQPSTDNLVLWNIFMQNMLMISTAKPSSLEHLEHSPKLASFLLIGDIRSKTSILVDNTWQSLGVESSLEDKARFQMEKFGGFQSQILSIDNYKLLKKLFLFLMQRSKACLSVGNKIFWSIIVTEILQKESLFDLERESVSALYDLFQRKNRYTPQISEIYSFINSIQKFSKKMDIEDADIGEVNKLINTLFRYLNSLSELKKVPDGDEFDDDRTFHNLSISSFLMNVDRPEIFQSFINEMYEKNISKSNFVQAALSLELLANTYDWDNTIYLPACEQPHLPSQTAFKRKAHLFNIIANSFVKGHKLEQAVDIYSEMLEAYMNINFDLNGLSVCHSELAKLYKALQTVDRLESTFFKISFIGLGFPESLRGKEFVYEGLPYEHITSINTRLTRLYPGSKVIINDDEAAKLLKENPLGKFLHVKTVNPSKRDDSTQLSFMARQYFENKNLNTFVNIRRLPGASSIANLWTEKTTYITYLTFPTLMNRSEIKNVTVVKIPPVKNAIGSLSAKNEELASLEYLIHQNLKDNISLESIASSSMFNSMTRILAGTVDSPVNGGAGEFKIFLSGSNDIDKGEPDEEFSRDCVILSHSFKVLTQSLNSLLKLHKMIIPSSLKLQHDSMEDLFKKNFASEIEELGLDVTTPLQYENLMNSLTTTNVHSKHRHSHFDGGSDVSTNIFGSQITRSSSHNTIGSATRRPSSLNSFSNQQHSSTHGSLNGRLSAFFSSGRDESTITTSDSFHGDENSQSRVSSGVNSFTKRVGHKKTNILNYK